MDREKVIKGLQNLRDAIATDFIHEADQAVGTIDDALAMLKEQQQQIWELQDQVEYLTDKQKTANIYKCQNCGTWVSAENVVRCKDCKHWNLFNGCNKLLLSCDADWFCADGERKDS